MSSKLPNNEKIFFETSPRKYEWQKKSGRESCKDLLGTEFYYHDFNTNKMRKAIEHMEALNREDSLQVLGKKFDKFLDMKKDKQKGLEFEIDAQKKLILEDMQNFDYFSTDFDKGFWDRINEKTYDKAKMVSHKDNMQKVMNDLFGNIEKYIQLRNSADSIKAQKETVKNEIARLQQARESGNLIDISQRVFVYDPNKPLWDALQNPQEAKNKMVALPNMTISIQKILKDIGATITSKDIAEKAIKYIDKLIERDIFKI